MRWLALAAALCAAAVIPAGPPGVGVVIVAVLIAAAAAAVRRPTAHAALLGALAVVLASFAALRDAGWVVALDLSAAWLVASVAAAGTRVAAVAAPFGGLNDLPSVLPRGAGRLGPAFRGACLGGFLVVPFAALFLAADAAFAELGGRIPLPSGHSLPLRTVIFTVVLACALGLALAARRPAVRPERRDCRRLGPVEWAIPLSALVTLFAAFVAVQLAVLFGGHDHVLETAGLTYAEYAREGFWELLAAAALTLAVLGLAVRFAGTPRRAHRILLRALLGALCLLTLVILASALHRLHLYEDAYGLTRARLGAEAVVLWLGGTFALVVLSGVVRRVRARFAELAVAGTTLALIAFSLADPDRLIAERNVDHWRETGAIDLTYLAGLSADAVPALDGLPEPLRSAALGPLAEEVGAGQPWSSANLARSRARDVLSSARRSGAPARARSPRSRPLPQTPTTTGTSR
jgi:Domain of unknown function (DUF4173)